MILLWMYTERMPSKKQKCFHCMKKELICFVCASCDHTFCMRHKMPEDHQCNANYQNKDSLQMEALQPIKVDKI